MMSENEIAKIIVDTAIDIHKKLGPGIFENVFEIILAYELRTKYDLDVQTQVVFPVIWDDMRLEIAFRADIVVGHKVIVELKCIEKLIPVHSKQLLTYLKLSGLKLGLLINFNEELLKNGIKRVVNGL